MVKISANIGLNIPEGSDVFNYDTFLKQNFETLDDFLAYLDGELKLSGATLDRPTTGNYIGRRYWDVTLQKPVFWTGAAWKDASGAIV